MKNILYVYIFLHITATASLIDTYKNTKFFKEPNKLYSLQSIKINTTNYQEKIRLKLYEEIALQIYTVVNATTTSQKNLKDDEYTKSFYQNTTLTTKNIPLYKIQYIDEKIENGVYSVLASFDYKKAFPIYKRNNNQLVDKINTLYTAYTNEEMLNNQETILKQIINSYEKHEKYLFILYFIAPKKNILKPQVRRITIENALDSLYDKNANNIRDLAIITVKRLNLSKIDGSLKLEPISLRDGHLYSEFSYEFKSYLSNALKSTTLTTESKHSDYTVKGFYHLNSNNVVVDITVVNKRNHVVTSAIAQMKIKNSDILLKKYEPLKDRGEHSEILDEYMQSW